MRDAKARLAANIPEGFAGNAHGLLVAIYKDAARPIEVRLDAAKAAVRFERPVLAPGL
jgi:hypothetical protein